jgi:hypothetical protein
LGQKQANGSGPEEGKGEEYWRKKAEELKEVHPAVADITFGTLTPLYTDR